MKENLTFKMLILAINQIKELNWNQKSYNSNTLIKILMKNFKATCEYTN